MRYRSKIIGLILLLLLVGLVGTPIWLTYKQARQDGLNRSLIAAIQREDVPAALAALDAGADPNSREDTSQPLSFWQSLRRLFTSRGQPEKPSSQGTTDRLPALMLAAEIEYEEGLGRGSAGPLASLIPMLAVKGADVNVRDNAGQTPLILAAATESGSTVSALLDKGAEANARAQEGYTALSLAAGADRPENVKFLLAKGAEVNARDNSGITALMRAAEEGSIASIKVLLAGGAKVEVRDKDRNTALDWALGDAPDPAIIHLLKQAGAKE